MNTELETAPNAAKAAEKNGNGKSANLSVTELGALLGKSERTRREAGTADADAGKDGDGTSRETKADAKGTKNGTQTVSPPNAEAEAAKAEETRRAALTPEQRATEDQAKADAAKPKPLTQAALTKGFQTLGLNAEQQTAVTALLKSGGELDVEALKLTPEQEEGLGKLLEAPAEGAAAADEAGGEGNEPETGRKDLPKEVAEAMAELKKAGNKGAADLLKRVHTVVDQRDTERMGRLAAERDNEALRAQIEEVRKGGSGGSTPTISEDPVMNHPEVHRVATQLQAVDNYLAWAEAHAEGGEIDDGKGGKQFLDAAAVAKLAKNGERLRTDLVIVRRDTERNVRDQYESASANFHQQAVKLYPWLADTKSEEYKRMDNLLKALPQLKGFADRELIIGDFFRGQQLRLAAEKAGARGKRTVKIPARVVAEGGDNAPGGEDDGEGGREQKQFEKTGRVKDLAKSFAARRTATQGRR